MKRVPLAALIILAASLLQPQQPAQPDNALPISQVEAVVADSKGLPVTNLHAADFAVVVDGRPQAVTNVSYFAGDPRARGPLVFVADNCDSSEPSLIAPLLTYFVDRKMEPGGLVSIMPVAESTGAGQQLTSDPGALREAIARTDVSMRTWKAYVFGPNVMGVDGQPSYHGLASFEAVSSAVDGLASLPGRKSVVLISQTLGWPPRIRGDSVRQLAGRANRAGVAIYLLDPGGWPVNMGAPHLLLTALAAEPEYLARATGGLSFHNDVFAPPTGRIQPVPDPKTGEMISPDLHKWQGQSAASLEKSLDKILDHMRGHGSGYYTIGYRSAGRQPGPTPRAVEVSVLRKGLTVRSWAGAAAAPRTRAQALLAALRSPLGAVGLRVQMLPFVSATDKDPKSGLRRPTLRALAAIDPRGLRFEDLPDGSKRATVNLVAEADGKDNDPARSEGTCGIRVSPAEFPKIGSRTLLCTVEMTLDKPGPYMVRMAAMDAGSGAAGSAYALAAVSNFNRDHIITSTLLLTRAPAEAPEPELHSRSSGKEEPPAGSGSALPTPAGANPVERVFAPGDTIFYECEVLGAKLEGEERLPRVDLLVWLWPSSAGSAPLVNRNREPLRPTSGPRQLAAGRLELPADIAPGHYYITLAAIDTLAHPALDYELGQEEMDFWVVKQASP